MRSGVLRRRLHHGDVDAKDHEAYRVPALDDLSEPLLGNQSNERHLKVDRYSVFMSVFVVRICLCPFGSHLQILMVYGGFITDLSCDRSAHWRIFGMKNEQGNTSTGHFCSHT